MTEKLTKEEKTKLLQQGLWEKCVRDSCPNPAFHNIPNKTCGTICQLIISKPRRIEALKRYVTNNRERWSTAHQATAETRQKISNSLQERHKTHRGPRKYLDKDEFITTSRTITLGQAKHKALKSKQIYSSLKGQFKVRAKKKINYKKGFYYKKEIPYRNEWDLKIFKSLDENPLVKSWTFLEDAVRATKETIPRHVVIDFKVQYHDNSTKMIIIRPEGIKLNDFEMIQFLEKNYANTKLEILTKEYFNSFSYNLRS